MLYAVRGTRYGGSNAPARWSVAWVAKESKIAVDFVYLPPASVRCTLSLKVTFFLDCG